MRWYPEPGRGGYQLLFPSELEDELMQESVCDGASQTSRKENQNSISPGIDWCLTLGFCRFLQFLIQVPPLL